MSSLLSDPTIADHGRSQKVEPDSNTRQVLFLVAALLVTTAVWVVLFVARVQVHQIDVDSYGYAYLARDLWESHNPVSSFLHTGSTSPLVPLVAAPGAAVGGVYGAMSVELPFLLMLVAGSYFLARVWTAPMAAMMAALLVALNEDVSSYAVRLNFAVPTTAALVWAFYSYIKSGHLRNWNWSLVFGVAIAAVLLSRSMSFVYVVPLVAVAAIDLAIDMVRHGHVLRLPALGALATTLVLAGPWWLVSGHQAIQYLQSAGYQQSSGYTSRGFALDATTVEQRARWTLSELGWGESWALGIAVLAALCAVVLRHRTLKLTALWMMALWVLLTGLVLSSSSNPGSGFGLPVIVVVILLAAAVLGQLSRRVLPLLAVPVAGILVVGLVAETTGGGQWWPAPYGGNVRTNSDLISAQAARLIGSSPTLLAQNTNFLSYYGIRWNDGANPLLLSPPLSLNGTGVAIGELARVKMVITGSSTESFDPSVNQSAIESAAHRDGFHVIRAWSVGQDQSGALLLWQRGNTTRTMNPPPPVTEVARPRDGSDVRGSVHVVATVSDRFFAATGVHFTVSGMGRSKTIPAVAFEYLWLGALDTSTLPDGTYTIQGVAVDVDGGVGRSKPITFHIDN